MFLFSSLSRDFEEKNDDDNNSMTRRWKASLNGRDATCLYSCARITLR